jgi:hypothetical protein
MGKLETLHAITAFGLLPHNIKYRVDELGSLCVMTLSPVISGTLEEVGGKMCSLASMDESW